MGLDAAELFENSVFAGVWLRDFSRRPFIGSAQSVADRGLSAEMVALGGRPPAFFPLRI
jgi:hypothetical protein